MKNVSVFLLLLVLFSCGKKESVSLPQSDITIIKEVQDYSPIYLFFKTDGNDTLVEVNRKNAISSTNWIFHIDKRLPLRLVISEIIKLQAKKEGSVHKSETSENYFSYSDSVHKNLAFIPFTNTHYNFVQPNQGVKIFFDKQNRIWINNVAVKDEKFPQIINNLRKDKYSAFVFVFAKELSFGDYLKDKIMIQKMQFSSTNLYLTNQEFVN